MVDKMTPEEEVILNEYLDALNWLLGMSFVNLAVAVAVALMMIVFRFTVVDLFRRVSFQIFLNVDMAIQVYVVLDHSKWKKRAKPIMERLGIYKVFDDWKAGIKWRFGK